MLIMFLGSATALQADEPRGAQLELSSKVVDLGTLSQSDDKQRVVVAYRNVGDVPLVVTEVRTSCSCTSSIYDRKRVMPDAEGQITFVMDPSKAPEGSFYRVVQIYSTSIGGVSYLTIKAEIE